MKDWFLEDPLHEILERHLFRSSTEDENSNEMVHAVIADYLLYLDSQGVHVPAKMKPVLVEDLMEEIKELIVKKTFGAAALDQNAQPVTVRRLNRRLA